MSNWTTTKSKQRLSWQGPEPQEITGQAYELAIGDGFLLDLGSNGNNLTIQPANAPTSWLTVRKQRLSWEAPPTDQAELLIGDIYNLSIGGGFQLDISGGGRNETPWTTTGKTGR